MKHAQNIVEIAIKDRKAAMLAGSDLLEQCRQRGVERNGLYFWPRSHHLINLTLAKVKNFTDDLFFIFVEQSACDTLRDDEFQLFGRMESGFRFVGRNSKKFEQRIATTVEDVDRNGQEKLLFSPCCLQFLFYTVCKQ